MMIKSITFALCGIALVLAVPVQQQTAVPKDKIIEFNPPKENVNDSYLRPEVKKDDVTDKVDENKVTEKKPAKEEEVKPLEKKTPEAPVAAVTESVLVVTKPTVEVTTVKLAENNLPTSTVNPVSTQVPAEGNHGNPHSVAVQEPVTTNKCTSTLISLLTKAQDEEFPVFSAQVYKNYVNKLFDWIETANADEIEDLAKNFNAIFKDLEPFDYEPDRYNYESHEDYPSLYPPYFYEYPSSKYPYLPYYDDLPPQQFPHDY